MKPLLKQTRSFILKSRGIINKSLVFGKVLDNRVLIGTHHKTGTVWMGNIFNSIASFYDLKISANRGNKSLISPSSNFDIFLQYHSFFDFDNISNYKGLHIIRDPRDIVVSGCFYHTKSSEKWLHIKREEFAGLTYQEKVNSYSSFDDKLIFEMEHSSKNVIQDMKSWNYDNPHFIEIKYEDLIQDVNLNLFREIFRFLGFNERIFPRLLKIAYRKSLFSGQVQNRKHIRSGKKQQWKEYFKPIHEERFVDLFDDVLIKLNYEKTQTGWLDR
ncbi:sulfotransferase domain-containing protein [Dapis sp. BLCC M126]|uniref:sulfotransferase domain-containing protein n=1 Tax=Dapis sp. BLCC M126 TaxID=3400189 RepID=UPI003CFBA5CA